MTLNDCGGVTVSHRIQITVNDELDSKLKTGASAMGLSVSSYARLALTANLLGKLDTLIAQAMRDHASDAVQTLTLDEFNQQIDEL